MAVWPVNAGLSRIFKYFFLKSKRNAAWTEAVQAEKYDVDKPYVVELHHRNHPTHQK